MAPPTYPATRDLNEHILRGRLDDAASKYRESATLTESTGQVTQGRDAIRGRWQEFTDQFASIDRVMVRITRVEAVKPPEFPILDDGYGAGEGWGVTHSVWSWKGTDRAGKSVCLTQLLVRFFGKDLLVDRELWSVLPTPMK